MNFSQFQHSFDQIEKVIHIYADYKRSLILCISQADHVICMPYVALMIVLSGAWTARLLLNYRFDQW
jgi:hypothetical protein